MVLCKNRPEGFGPHSQIHTNLPTTCFLDTVVVPLPTWIYMIALLALLPYHIRWRKRKAPIEVKNSPFTRGKLFIFLATIYYLLLVAMIAMVSLELARLSVAELGIGLLPFTYVGVLSAGLVHHFLDGKPSRLLSSLFWLMLAIAMSLKVAAYAYEGSKSRRGQQYMYPVSDQITDVAVMVGVEVVLAALELVTFYSSK